MVALLVPSDDCPGLAKPVGGEPTQLFAPVGQYGGHWGIDFLAAEGSAVLPADAGAVTFAGSVAGVLSVTVDHGGALRSSYSYLTSISVVRGQQVDRSTELGRSGFDHGVAAVHFSVRLEGLYTDPLAWIGCFRSPHRGLSLVPVDRQ